jgi:hypothetical protein
MNTKIKKISILVPLISLTWLCGCQVETPAASTEAQQPLFVHAKFIKNACVECHEKDRPEPFKKQLHGANKDCGGQCHISQDNPGKVSGWTTRKKYDHKPEPPTCFECHLKNDRPDSDSHKSVPPTQCITCHKYPKWLPLRTV